jgi:hypothetical protein
VNLEQAVHQRWAASEALAAMLAAERVTTGRSLGDSVPYATITRRQCRTAFRTNAGDALDEVTLRIHVWHDDHEAGRAIVEQVKATFDRSDFELAGGARVVQMRRAHDAAVQHDDGTWQFTVEFLVEVYLPSGVY